MRPGRIVFATVAFLGRLPSPSTHSLPRRQASISFFSAALSLPKSASERPKAFFVFAAGLAVLRATYSAVTRT